MITIIATPDDPIAAARLRRQPDGYRWIVLACPYCGRKHTHGGGTLTDDPRQHLGPRVAHCHGGDYLLSEAT